MFVYSLEIELVGNLYEMLYLFLKFLIKPIDILQIEFSNSILLSSLILSTYLFYDK